MLFTIIITTENTCTNCKMTALALADLNLLICILPNYDKKSGCIPKYAHICITIIQMHPIVVSTDWYRLLWATWEY